MKARMKILRTVFDSFPFKAAVLLLLAVAFFQTLIVGPGEKFFFGLYKMLFDPNTIFIFFLPSMLLVTLSTFNTFERYDSYVIRLVTKKQYFKELITNIFCANLIIFLIGVSFFLISYNILGRLEFDGEYPYYHIAMGLYFLFNIIRLFVLCQLIGLLNGCLLKLLNQKIVILINLAFYVLGFQLPNVSDGVINSISKLPLWITNYFGMVEFSSFGFEIVCSLIYIMGIAFVVGVFYYIASKRIRKIGD